MSGLKSLLTTDAVAAGKVLKSDPNTNLMEPKALIPMIQHKVEVQPGEKMAIATAVFAIAKGRKYITSEELFQRWSQQPHLGGLLSEI